MKFKPPTTLEDFFAGLEGVDNMLERMGYKRARAQLKELMIDFRVFLRQWRAGEARAIHRSRARVIDQSLLAQKLLANARAMEEYAPDLLSLRDDLESDIRHLRSVLDSLREDEAAYIARVAARHPATIDYSHDGEG